MERRTFMKIFLEGIALTVLAPSIKAEVPNTIVNITEADIRNAKLLEPGWYKVTIDSVTETVSKNRGTPLIDMLLTTVDEKVPIHHFISDVFPAPLVVILQKCGYDLTHDGPIDLDGCIGKEIEVRIENMKYLDRLSNIVKPFAHKHEREYSR